jgi:O-antigen biosynthesis protein
MRVAFLVHELARSGGVDVVLGHARRLAAHGAEAEVIVTGPDGVPDDPPESGGVPVRSLDEARGVDHDVVIGTWWETAWPLMELRAAHRLALLQSLESHFYPDDAPLERFGARVVLTLPVGDLAVSSWVRDGLLSSRPTAQCRVVPNGVDKQLFGANRRSPAEGPLRVLVEGQPELPFKGVRDALHAVAAMTQPVEVTLASLDVESARAAGLPADRVVGGFGHEQMAALYAESDVLLKLSRFEGLGLPPLEAFHAGVPCVVTPYGGHVDYVKDGRNGVLVDFDDEAGTAAVLDRLAGDRDRLEALSRGALETAEGWPSVEDSTRQLADAIEELVQGPAPDPAEALRALLAESRRTVDEGAPIVDGLRGSVEWNERALTEARAKVEELFEAIEFHKTDHAARINELTGSRTYRAADTARRFLKPRAGRRAGRRTR